MRNPRLARAASHARRRPEQWLSVRHGLARERTTTIPENPDAHRPRCYPSWVRCSAGTSQPSLRDMIRAQLTIARTWSETSAARHSTDHG